MAINIQIQDDTWIELNKRKQRGETFDDVIKRALREEPEIPTAYDLNKQEQDDENKR